jgi:hypothetical protein
LTIAVAVVEGGSSDGEKEREEKKRSKREREDKIDGQACDRRCYVHIHTAYIYI